MARVKNRRSSQTIMSFSASFSGKELRTMLDQRKAERRYRVEAFLTALWEPKASMFGESDRFPVTKPYFRSLLTDLAEVLTEDEASCLFSAMKFQRVSRGLQVLGFDPAAIRERLS